LVVDVKKLITKYYNQWKDFTIYKGKYEDPYYTTGHDFYKYEHATQNRWIWVRISDSAIVYEVYNDGTDKSYVKYFVGGIVEDNWIWEYEFRISKCANPFLALPKVPESFTSSFSLFEDAIAVQAPAEAVSLAGSKQKKDVDEFTTWIMKEYDLNKNGKLEEKEAQNLFKDVSNFDFGALEFTSITNSTQWMAKYDTNSDKSISLSELYNALQ
jgi:hypothetical protein